MLWIYSSLSRDQLRSSELQATKVLTFMTKTDSHYLRCLSLNSLFNLYQNQPSDNSLINKKEEGLNQSLLVLSRAWLGWLEGDEA